LVKGRQDRMSDGCPLYRQKRTFVGEGGRSACQQKAAAYYPECAAEANRHALASRLEFTIENQLALEADTHRRCRAPSPRTGTYLAEAEKLRETWKSRGPHGG
jgi:hypothetical protein